MATFKVETKNKIDIDKKPRVYFTCHPDDFEKHFKKVCDDIFKTHDCAIYYTEDMTEIIAEDEKQVDLGRNNLFVIPVTLKLLTTPNRAMNEDVPYALKEHIPVLPIMMESGIDEFYSNPNKFGELQYLNPYSTDLTEISYEEKLKKYLESVLISDELAKRVRAAFDAYIFLSYRKKDRKYANELMRLIHSNPECRDIAIWFDEFLTPGESFKKNIEKILDDCKLFTLLVTPHLLEKVIDENGEERDNYVISTELPLARKKKEEKGTDIFAVEMEKTDKEALFELSIEDYVNSGDEAFHARLLDAIAHMAITTNNTPEHDFLIGLAYLEGIDVEVNRKRAAELIEDAADAELAEAMVRLIQMYIDGVGVAYDTAAVQKWSKRLADNYFRKIFSKKRSIKSKKKLFELFSHYKDEYWADTIKVFLLYADERLEMNVINELYALLMQQGFCEYTLIFEACKNMTLHQEETQIILVIDILSKSVDGTYPPYGPLFWYVPEYYLYEVALLALDTLKSKSNFPKILALVRDVCWIFGKKNTCAEITDRIFGNELYNIAKRKLTGIRDSLCKLFYTGDTDYKDSGDIYPRCFNVSEAKSLKNSGCGILGQVQTCFEDELGLYLSNAYNLVDDSFIGLVSCENNYDAIETLKQKSTKKMRGLIITPSSSQNLTPLKFNTANLEIVFLPENIRFIPAEAFSNCKSLLYVHIPVGVESIGYGAFENCSKLHSVELPEGLKYIDVWTFQNCISLKNITLPTTLESIGIFAFGNCCELEAIAFPEGFHEIQRYDDIYAPIFSNCKNLKFVSLPNSLRDIEAIEASEFDGCINLSSLELPSHLLPFVKIWDSKTHHKLKIAVCDEENAIKNKKTLIISIDQIDMSPYILDNSESYELYVLPEGTTSIPAWLFSNRTDITSVIITEGVTKIGSAAFINCINIEKIEFPKSLMEIDEFAFRSCLGLTAIEIPDSVLKLGNGIFNRCVNLQSVILPLGLTEIPHGLCFNCFNLREITIPNCATRIERFAFESCRMLKSIALPDTIEEICKGAFDGCSSLEQINLPTSFIKNIGYRAFYGCSNLSNIKFPQTVETIGASAFENCTSLNIISWPDSIKELGNASFQGCRNITSVRLWGEIKTISYSAFRDCHSLKEVELSPNILCIHDSAFKGCSELTSINLPEEIQEVECETFMDCKKLRKVILSRNTKVIGRAAFKGCTSLKAINIPDSVTKIDVSAFESCVSLTSITVPTSVCIIYKDAFGSCTDLKEISIPQQFKNKLSQIFSDVDLTQVTMRWT